jgi:hypothetical protein
VTVMHDTKLIRGVYKKLLQSMKTEEEVTVVVQTQYLIDNDLASLEALTALGFNPARPLVVDIDLKKLAKVDDIYKD